MTKDEALKLAFEALKDMNCGWKYIRESHGDLYGVGWDRAQQKADDAITALRQALDHVPDTTKMIEPDMGIDRGAWDDVPDATKWVDELRGGDETEEEPVAWVKMEEGEIVFDIDFSFGEELLRQLETEHNVPLYLAPHKREWVGLTDEEIAEGAKQSWVDKQAFESAVWWAEEKLRDKNGF